MFKTLLVALALFAGTAQAADNAQANVSLQNKLMDHGVVVSDEPTVGVGLRFNDVLVDGAFVRGNFDSVKLTPVNGTVEFRSDLGVGYATKLGSVNLEGSVNRVINPVIYTGDYTEARLHATRGAFFAEVNQGLTANVNQDTYAAVGIEQKIGRARVGGLVSTTRYNTAGLATRDEFNFNNAEVFATYNIWRGLDASIHYSEGGRGRDGVSIDQQVWGGINYRF
jgi:hypothetical protein